MKSIAPIILSLSLAACSSGGSGDGGEYGPCTDQIQANHGDIGVTGNTSLGNGDHYLARYESGSFYDYQWGPSHNGCAVNIVDL